MLYVPSTYKLLKKGGITFCILVFKCVHGLARNYLNSDITVYVDIHGYDKKSRENMEFQ